MVKTQLYQCTARHDINLITLLPTLNVLSKTAGSMNS